MKKGRRVQLAALPFRLVDGQLQILLITSRETRRWVIPKGWPERRVPPHVQAAREAHEEAGLIGRIATEPVGQYRYLKRLDDGSLRPCQVDVFLFDVTEELDDWPERHEREKRWMTPQEAAQAVVEGSLSELILAIARIHAGSAPPAGDEPQPPLVVATVH
ncbi:NUDIX hydrolase [Zavarzinia sp. CC-PAN008]|uniref:NUDIX hydrolase n=1 Tax=Zavarzinia sp. CC-PAN008 TaxID=3243332 RepID=UPI003F748872